MKPLPTCGWQFYRGTGACNQPADGLLSHRWGPASGGLCGEHWRMWRAFDDPDRLGLALRLRELIYKFEPRAVQDDGRVEEVRQAPCEHCAGRGWVLVKAGG